MIIEQRATIAMQCYAQLAQVDAGDTHYWSAAGGNTNTMSVAAHTAPLKWALSAWVGGQIVIITVN